MKFNKMVILALLAIFVVAIAGTASAFEIPFIGDVGGDDTQSEPQDITVGGIDFQIPGGYEVNENYTVENDTQSTGGEYTVSTAGYEDSTKENAIFIMVGDYGEYNMTMDILDAMADSIDGKAKTINGHDGYLSVKTAEESDNADSLVPMDYDTYMFTYVQDGDLVIVATTNESVISEVIVE